MKNVFPKAPPQEGEQSQQEQLLEMLRSNPQLMKKYQQELTKMQSKAGSKMRHQPITNKEYLQKVKSNQIEQLLDQEGGLVIKPQQSFVLKFLDKRTGEKIFVNVVNHEAVDHPEEKQLIDYDNQTGLRIPMSMSVMKEDRDKNGNVCKVVDVVMNPKIIATAETNPDILQFMGQIIANYLLEKHKIAVSEQMLKKVKGLKYKGSTVELQRVKAKKAPKIQQVPGESTEQQKKQKSEQQRLFSEMNGQFDQEKKISRPDFRIHIINTDGKKEEYAFDTFKKAEAVKVMITIDLNMLIHSRGIHLEGSTNFLLLSVKGLYELCLKMPVEIASFKAVFGRNKRKLLIEADAKAIELKNDNKNASNQEAVKSKNEQSEVRESKKVIDVKIESDLLDDLV